MATPVRWFALMLWLMLTVGCAPDGGDPPDADTGSGDASDAADADVSSPDAEDADDEPDVCQPLSSSEFCEQHDATCGMYTGEGRCEAERTEFCGSCPSSDACSDNQCICNTPWADGGIEAAFGFGPDFVVMNLGYVWVHSHLDDTWTEPVEMKDATEPIDFASAPDVIGRKPWSDGGPTAAAMVGDLVVLFNGWLYWVYDTGRDRWTSGGDLEDPNQVAFDLRANTYPYLFDGGFVDAALSRFDDEFYVLHEGFLHGFIVQEDYPVKFELRTYYPVPASDIFMDELFGGATARPWDHGNLWGAYNKPDDIRERKLLLGDAEGSWFGDADGPLTRIPVDPRFDMYAGAACGR